MHSTESKVAPCSEYFVYQPSSTACRLYLYPIAVGCFHYESGYHLSRLSYDSFLFMYIQEGSCQILVQGDSCCAKAGQFVLLDCYKPHEYGFPCDSVVTWIHFDGPLAREYYNLITAEWGKILTSQKPYPVIQRMDQILNLFRNSEPIRESEVSELLTQLLNQLLVNHCQIGSPSYSATVVEHALSYINEHYRESISLSQLANQVNMSSYYFTRIFKAETGFTPYQYLISTRIECAKFLLVSSELSVKEIAFASGFHSESGFCSAFKKRTLFSPSEFRSKVNQ